MYTKRLQIAQIAYTVGILQIHFNLYDNIYHMGIKILLPHLLATVPLVFVFVERKGLLV